jgi:methionyl-tRNA formyltransferase
MKKYKIAFFGTPAFTTDFLDLFYNLKNAEGGSFFDLSLVITGEDKPVGRGMQMQAPAPKKWAEQLPRLLASSHPPLLLKGEFPKVLQPKKLDGEFYNILKTEHEKENFDLFIVIAYGKIIPEKIINLPKYGTINLHYSLLPKYRGASPVESAILNNETETGITIQQMKFELDAGDILFQEKIEIDENESTTELRSKLNKRALEIFPDFLKYKLGIVPLSFGEGLGVRVISQDNSQATFCKKIKKEEMDVSEDLKNKNLEIIFTKWKAFDKKIYFFIEQLPRQIFAKFATSSKEGEPRTIRIKITEMKKENGEIKIIKLLPESKKEISLLDFENSYGKLF